MSYLSSDIYQLLLEQSRVGLLVISLETGKVTFINSALKSICNISASSEKPINELLIRMNKEDIQYLEEIFHQFKTGKIKSKDHIQVQLKNTDGTLLTLEGRASSFMQEGKMEIGCFVDDVTNRKRNQDILVKYNSKKNSTIEILSHDIQGPLGLIKNTASVIEDKLLQVGAENLKSFTNYIQQLSSRTLELVNSLNSVEYEDTAVGELKVDRIDVVQKLLYGLEVFMSSSGIINRQFKMTYSKKNIYAEVDEAKLITVGIINLVSNAIKFTHDEGKIHINIEDYEDVFQVSVADNGIGISESMASNLFQKYSESGRTGLRGERSIGLGLFIVKKIVDLHEGKIWYESEVDKGTTFYVEIPKIFRNRKNL